VSKRMSEHHRKNLELLYQTNIQVILMWIGAAVIAVVTGFFGFQSEGTARTIVGYGGFIAAVILLVPAAMTAIKTRTIMKALDMETTIAKYLAQKKKKTG